MKKFGYVRIV